MFINYNHTYIQQITIILLAHAAIGQLLKIDKSYSLEWSDYIDYMNGKLPDETEGQIKNRSKVDYLFFSETVINMWISLDKI